MLGKLREGLRRFLAGRNGADELAIFALALYLVLLIAGRLWWLPLTGLAYAAAIYALFRCFSRNVAARRRENQSFLRPLRRLRDRDHRYLRCPKCRKTLRVPRGKGRISVRCPHCGERFEKTT